MDVGDEPFSDRATRLRISIMIPEYVVNKLLVDAVEGGGVVERLERIEKALVGK